MPHCEAGLCGGIAFLLSDHGLVDEHVENALADLAFMEMSTLPLIEATAACSGFKQSAIFDVVYNLKLHDAAWAIAIPNKMLELSKR